MKRVISNVIRKTSLEAHFSRGLWGVKWSKLYLTKIAFFVLIMAFTSVALTAGSAKAPALTKADRLELELAQFLKDKNSPLPASELVKHDNWKMIVAISAAESGYGQHTIKPYNAWGIKATSDEYRSFDSWEESIAYTSDLLYEYDPEDGNPDPEAMVATWKYVKPFHGWLGNVNYALWDIKQNVPKDIRLASAS